jgi:hypothetical protein
MYQHVSLVVVGIHVYALTVIRLPSLPDMGAARGRRDAAFQPVLTRDTLRDMEREVFTLLSTAGHGATFDWFAASGHEPPARERRPYGKAMQRPRPGGRRLVVSRRVRAVDRLATLRT